MSTKRNEFVKIGVNAFVFGGLLYYLAPGKEGNLVVYGMDVPAWAVGAGIGAVSTVAVDAAHEWILPHISKDSKFQNLEALALGVGVAGLASGVTLTILNKDAAESFGWGKYLGIAAVGEVGGHLVYEFLQGEPIV